LEVSRQGRNRTDFEDLAIGLAPGSEQRFQLRTLAENIFGIGERYAPRLRQLQSSTLADEQFMAQTVLKFADLAGQRRLGYMEGIRCAGQVAGARHFPEIVQMVVVQAHKGSPVA